MHIILFLTKKKFKESLRYLFNVVILFNTVFYLKIKMTKKIYVENLQEFYNF